jgi:hypothetical protein
MHREQFRGGGLGFGLVVEVRFQAPRRHSPISNAPRAEVRGSGRRPRLRFGGGGAVPSATPSLPPYAPRAEVRFVERGVPEDPNRPDRRAAAASCFKVL